MKKQILKFTAFLLILSGIAASCNTDEYPKEISFTEFSLKESCQWTNLPYDEKVMIINSSEELKQYISSMDGSYPAIDFTNNVLLLVSGTSTNNIPEITLTNLQQLTSSNYSLRINITINDVVETKQWVKALIVKQIKKDSYIEIKINLDMQIDFANIENLYEQPLPVIKKCLHGKWKANNFSVDLGHCYQYNTYINIDTENNCIQVTIGKDDCIPIWSILSNFQQTQSPFNWKKEDIYENSLGHDYCNTMYVMKLDDKCKFWDLHVEGWYLYLNAGWIFNSIHNDELKLTEVIYKNIDFSEICIKVEECTFNRFLE